MHFFAVPPSVRPTSARLPSLESLSILAPADLHLRTDRRVEGSDQHVSIEVDDFLRVLEAHSDAVAAGSKTFLGRFPMTIAPQ